MMMMTLLPIKMLWQIWEHHLYLPSDYLPKYVVVKVMLFFIFRIQTEYACFEFIGSSICK